MQISDPANHAFAITPNDTTPVQSSGVNFATHAIYVGTAGNITLKANGSPNDVVFKNVPAGFILPVRATFVRATGTTATDLVGLRNTQ